MARIRALLPLLALAACGGGGRADDSFAGTFLGTFNAEPVTLTLKEDGKALSGTIRWSGVEARVSATFDGARMTGTVRQPEMGFEAPFEATIRDHTIDWVYTLTDPSGQKSRLPLVLTREGKVPPQAVEERRSLDPELVGRWSCDLGRTAMAGKALATRIGYAFNADGTFEYGSAESVIEGDKGTGHAPVTRGQWKTEGQVLHSRAGAHGPWLKVGRYVVSGSELVMYLADGTKQIWNRE